MSRIEGKTKWLEFLDGGLARVHSKDDITAGDGAKHHVLKGKGKLANATSCNVFELLQLKGVSVAYIERDGKTFVTQMVDMIPVEVVVRNEAAGSYCNRTPEVSPGTVFQEPVVEFYYKTNGRKFFGETLEVDDPLMIFPGDGSELSLHHPGKPLGKDNALLTVSNKHILKKDRKALFEKLAVCYILALQVNENLKRAWQQQDGRLVDFKIECGVTHDGQIVVADVIDCDSWRVMWKGQQLSKQKYRDGGSLDDVLRVYAIAEKLSRAFVEMADGW